MEELTDARNADRSPRGSDHGRTVLIQPVTGVQLPDTRELWDYRVLLLFLMWRDIAVRYKQTALGVLWAIIQPLVSVFAFSLFFGKLAHVSSDGKPYALFTFCAVLPWFYFANALSSASNSLVSSANLITKIYFPRLILPIAATLEGLVDFAISFVMLLCVLAYYHVPPSPTMLWLPVFLLLAVATALAAGLWFSALNVRYRDVRYTIPFLTQVGLFVTPVVYSSRLIKEPWHTLYGLNPMAAVVEGFRWAILGTSPPGPMIALSAAVVIALLLSGLVYFSSVEHRFADTV